ncbi:hypothetical protein [Streptomyces sp. DH24]|uniref:hypothetical protein n=1 Tax=Streptomyces sp. DH24 TaxID=3040123 RepID=UPI00244354CD|nr:hypothetical protein [Streptomyces sp. DH24]MDG9719120.1 hypothetical protein [Streptomyces sp. DH24]
MYGHGAAPPTRSAATVITLRVLFAAAGVLTCGVFACVPLFRVALLRGRWFHWAAAWLSLPVCIACFMVVGALPEGDRRADVALAAVLLIGAASSAWFLTVDIRFHNELRRGAGYLPSRAPTVHSGYGYQQAVPPYAPTPVPHSPHSPATPAPMPPARPPASHAPPVPPPAGPPPGPARIDQVRAELDELSDYLRRQDGTQQDGR